MREPTFSFGDFPTLATERVRLCEYEARYVDDAQFYDCAIFGLLRAEWRAP